MFFFEEKSCTFKSTIICHAISYAIKIRAQSRFDAVKVELKKPHLYAPTSI